MWDQSSHHHHHHDGNSDSSPSKIQRSLRSWLFPCQNSEQESRFIPGTTTTCVASPPLCLGLVVMFWRQRNCFPSLYYLSFDPPPTVFGGNAQTTTRTTHSWEQALLSFTFFDSTKQLGWWLFSEVVYRHQELFISVFIMFLASFTSNSKLFFGCRN